MSVLWWLEVAVVELAMTMTTDDVGQSRTKQIGGGQKGEYELERDLTPQSCLERVQLASPLLSLGE